MQVQAPLTVLIVDDDFPIRQELRAFPWQECNAVLIGEAENGEEALDMCREYLPNIVIADITMPLMNGLELLKAIRSEMPLIKVILLTCHTEFAYAQEALKLGAIEYLTKIPLEDDDIRLALEKARDLIARDQLSSKAEIVHQRNQLARTVTKIVSGRSSPEEAQTLLHYPLRLIFLRVDAQAAVKTYIVQEIEEALGRLDHLLNERFQWTLMDGQFVFLRETAQQEANKIERTLEAVMHTLRHMLQQNMGGMQDDIQLYMIVSETVHSSEEIVKAFHSSALWDKHKFYERRPMRSPIYTGKPIPLHPVDGKQAAELAKLFHQLVKETGDEEAWLRSEFYAQCMKNRYEPAELKHLVHSLMKGYHAQGASAAEPARLYEPILQAHTLYELLEAVHNLKSVQNAAARKGRKEIEDALAYMAAHLHEDLTLASVADKVGLSPSYFSKVFREQVGEPFSDYLIRKRVEKAEELLRDTNLKVYEVAERIGIPSYRYFTAVFKEKTGLTPTDYKRG
ncbi:response regulator [Paenibacillus thalictri]|uniref:Response regulator n=1 Tax=Paenibacillus thalictri TaxID=2527873 RepID=A0A4Q9E1D0_9BACL|nr:response regulator [Paenibacillus thalictri]